jgi:hypothetical protein
MKKWLIGGMIVAALAVGVAFLWPLSSVAQQAQYRAPRAADGKPDLNGVWQALNNAHWYRDHVARQGLVFSLGAAPACRAPASPRRGAPVSARDARPEEG